MLENIYELFNLQQYGLIGGIAILAIFGLIYVYRDGKKERKERQVITDGHNNRWLRLYEKSVDETSKLRKEMSGTREVMAGLKGVIENIYKLSVAQMK